MGAGRWLAPGEENGCGAVVAKTQGLRSFASLRMNIPAGIMEGALGAAAPTKTAVGATRLAPVAGSAGFFAPAPDIGGLKVATTNEKSKERPASEGRALQRQEKRRPSPRQLTASKATQSKGLEDFDGEGAGAGADRDHSDEGVGAGAKNGEVGGILVNNEEHGGYFAGVGGRKTHRGRGSSDRDGLADATIEDI